MKVQNNLHSFIETYRTEDDCFAKLVQLKWGAGYSCLKCGYNVSCKGRTWHHKRCRACGYDESCTAHTLFHKLKFPLPVAFVIIYQLTTMKKGMSSVEISRQHGIHQESAWFFKRKVQQAMQAADGVKLEKIVEVDETMIGGFEKGAVGRTHGKKKSIQIAVELGKPSYKHNRAQMLRAKALVIDDFSSASLTTAITKMVNERAVVVTDLWSAYPRAVGKRAHIALASEHGESMPEIHRLIFNLKNWLRGIHHNVSKAHLQSYLNEFFFRFNYRNRIKSLPKIILNKMVQHQWFPYKSAVAS